MEAAAAAAAAQLWPPHSWSFRLLNFTTNPRADWHTPVSFHPSLSLSLLLSPSFCLPSAVCAHLSCLSLRATTLTRSSICSIAAAAAAVSCWSEQWISSLILSLLGISLFNSKVCVGSGRISAHALEFTVGGSHHTSRLSLDFTTHYWRLASGASNHSLSLSLSLSLLIGVSVTNECAATLSFAPGTKSMKQSCVSAHRKIRNSPNFALSLC